LFGPNWMTFPGRGGWSEDPQDVLEIIAAILSTKGLTFQDFVDAEAELDVRDIMRILKFKTIAADSEEAKLPDVVYGIVLTLPDGQPISAAIWAEIVNQLEKCSKISAKGLRALQKLHLSLQSSSGPGSVAVYIGTTGQRVQPPQGLGQRLSEHRKSNTPFGRVLWAIKQCLGAEYEEHLSLFITSEQANSIYSSLKGRFPLSSIRAIAEIVAIHATGSLNSSDPEDTTFIGMNFHIGGENVFSGGSFRDVWVQGIVDLQRALGVASIESLWEMPVWKVREELSLRVCVKSAHRHNELFENLIRVARDDFAGETLMGHQFEDVRSRLAAVGVNTWEEMLKHDDFRVGTLWSYICHKGGETVNGCCHCCCCCCCCCCCRCRCRCRC
jgi:hypothetical protein